MATYIKTLKDKFGNFIAPRTKTNAVTTDTNELLSDVLTNISSDLTDVSNTTNNHVASNVLHNNYAVASGTDNYIVTLNPAPTSYVAGLVVSFKATNENTGASTLNCNSLGVKPIKKNVTDDLVSGDIKANQITKVVYDGTNFQIIGITSATDYNNLANRPIVSGVLQQLTTANSNTSYTTKQVRNIIISTLDADLGSMGNGDIWIKI